MTKLMSQAFPPLAVNGHNYLTWAMDAKVHLYANELMETLEETPEGVDPPTNQAKYNALEILRHHIHPDLKNEYLMEENPRTLWLALKERYDHQRELILPEARHEWNNLRFEDFKTVSDYNSAVHVISSKLTFCEQPLTDTEKIEKTLSTFHPNYILLQQQYRTRNFQRYSDLIFTLLQAET